MTYPTDRLEPRLIENLPGEMYDPAKTKQLFVEDIIQITNDLRAVEDEIEDVVKPSIGEGGGGMENPLTVDLDFDGYKAIALACDNGATLPATPVIGQWFLHTPTGRQVLMQYNGTSWTPMMSLSSTTIYVDSTGTDDQEHGFGTGTDAYLTLAYALTQIRMLLGGSVVVNLASGSFAGGTINPIAATNGGYTVTIKGELSLNGSLTISSATASTGTTLPTVSDTGAGWTTDQHRGNMIKFTSGANNGIYKVVKSNTSEVLTLVGTLATAPTAGDTYEFVTWETAITSTIVGNIEDLGLTDVKLDMATQASYCLNLKKKANLTRVKQESYYLMVLDTTNQMITCNTCSLMMEYQNRTTLWALNMVAPSQCTLMHTLIYPAPSVTTACRAIGVSAGCKLIFRDHSVISGISGKPWAMGIDITAGGVVEERIASFIEYCDDGIICNGNGSVYLGTGAVTQFANCTRNVTALAGLYSTAGVARGPHTVEGSVALVNGTAQVTLTGDAAAFSSSTSYTVLLASTLNDRTLKVVNNSSTQFTITSSDLTDTDTVRFVIIGS
jgi:hypothetical protein